MTINEFKKIIKAQLGRCEHVLLNKGNEYTDTSVNSNKALVETDTRIDRLAHFKKAAALQNETPKQAAFGMLAKHLVSVSDMVASEEIYSASRWDEKLTDSINYLLIIRAIIEEELLPVKEVTANE